MLRQKFFLFAGLQTTAVKIYKHGYLTLCVIRQKNIKCLFRYVISCVIYVF